MTTRRLNVTVNSVFERLKIKYLMSEAVFFNVRTTARNGVAFTNAFVAIHPTNFEKNHPRRKRCNVCHILKTGDVGGLMATTLQEVSSNGRTATRVRESYLLPIDRSNLMYQGIAIVSRYMFPAVVDFSQFDGSITLTGKRWPA